MTDESPDCILRARMSGRKQQQRISAIKHPFLRRCRPWESQSRPGFTLSVDICEEYFRNGQELPDDVPELLRQGLAFIERSTGLQFGTGRRPLLVSAPVRGIRKHARGHGNHPQHRAQNGEHCGDWWHRLATRNLPGTRTGGFWRISGPWSSSIDPEMSRKIEHLTMDREGVPDDAGLDFAALRSIAEQYEQVYPRTNGKRLPDDVFSQLELAATAILQSWDSQRARMFRSMNLISGARGTGVTVESMVFGNLGSLSGAGVAFSRNPWTGTNELLVDFKFGAQGEDIVSGLMGVVSHQEFAARIPLAARELSDAAKRLESLYHDMQDIEFTVQEGKLFILQSRAGKRAPLAALKIAVDLVQEKSITPEEALGRVRDIDTEALTVQTISASEPPLAAGISASMGVASGKVALTTEHAIEFAKNAPVILVRETATPDDIEGIGASGGLLTVRGARTSHAAVVARQMGKVCIVSCGDLKIDRNRRVCSFPGRDLFEGDTITLDGQSGKKRRDCPGCN